MSQKYAGLPDIDASQDVYETPDAPPSPILKDEPDLDEAHLRAARLAREREKEAEREARRAAGMRGLVPAPPGNRRNEAVPAEELEEIDFDPGLGVERGRHKWKKLEKRATRMKVIQALEVEETPLQRFVRLQEELVELEDEVKRRREEIKPTGSDARPSSSISETAAEASTSDRQARPKSRTTKKAPSSDPGSGLVHSLLELRERLGKLDTTALDLDGTLEYDASGEAEEEETEHVKTNGDAAPHHPAPESEGGSHGGVDIVSLDKRLASLETLLGSSNISPADSHPPPLLTTMTKLETQLSLLVQPRHLDGLSRRLKGLLTDLERYEQGNNASGSSQQPAMSSWAPAYGPARRQPPPAMATADATGPAQPSTASLLTFMSRLDPLLPTIPPLLLRLRSLSALHASASTFGSRLKEAEEREKAMEAGLEELERAVETMEHSLQENKGVVGANFQALDVRMRDVARRLAALEGTQEEHEEAVPGLSDGVEGAEE